MVIAIAFKGNFEVIDTWGAGYSVSSLTRWVGEKEKRKKEEGCIILFVLLRTGNRIQATYDFQEALRHIGG